MNRALDVVRRRENRQLLEEDAHSLVGTKFDFLYALERIYNDALQRLERVRDAGYKSARARSIKELLRGLLD